MIKFSFSLAQMCWHLNMEGDEEVPFLIFGDMLDSVSFEFQHFSILGSRLYLNTSFSEHGDFDSLFDSKNSL